MAAAQRSPGAGVRVSLFWRTSLMIGALIVASVVGTLQLVRAFSGTPADQQLAWELSAIVNLTRSALVSSQGERRRLLLDELAHEEGVRVVPLESTDRTQPLARNGQEAELARLVAARLRSLLGPRTRLVGEVNGERALWVSFDIEGDAYWLGLDRERFDRQVGPNWLLVGLMAVALAMLGSLVISRAVNRPLARLAAALVRVSRGESPPKLREDLPSEIAEVNRRFNRMAADLAQLEADRALSLAGISHDIRTPLSRLRLEVELSSLADQDKQSMADDIERIDRIVGQFVEYGRSGQGERVSRTELVDVDAAVAATRAAYHAAVDAGELRIDASVPPATTWRGDALDLARVLGNLVENALRYGRSDPASAAHVEIRAARRPSGLAIEVRDHGPGVPEDQLERLLRPFSRLDTERSTRGGSGLGLAIVARIAQRYDGSCRLERAAGGGLAVHVVLPDAPARNSDR